MFAKTWTISERMHKILIFPVASGKEIGWQSGVGGRLFAEYTFVLFEEFTLCIYYFKTLKQNLTF